MVGHAFFLLEGWFMLLVHHDQPGLGPWQKQGRARTHHNLRLAGGHAAPDPLALARAHRRMPFGRRNTKAFFHPAQERTGQGNLRQQQ
jgi:hypothetical protein